MARILIVDDSIFLTKQIRSFLEDDGHEVIAIGHNGHEGLALYREHTPDLILLDLTMPGMDGLTCLEEIFSAHEDARVLVVSAVKNPTMIMKCLNTGARGFVEKPLKFRDESFCSEMRDQIASAIED